MIDVNLRRQTPDRSGDLSDGNEMADGFATEADVERWGAAFARIDAAERRPWVFPPTLVAVGRRATI